MCAGTPSVPICKIRDESQDPAVHQGHADISVTLNTYTHVNYEDAKGELLRLAHA